jgi:hypothetical protein
MLGLLGAVRPRWPHLALGRSRRAGLDILGHIFFENLLTQHGPSHTSIPLRVGRPGCFGDYDEVHTDQDRLRHLMTAAV